MTYRARREARADRLREWASTRERKAASAFAAVHRIADGIPFGQPILVGHHSERHARRDQERIHNGMSQGIEHERKAAEMSSRAANIDDAAAGAIYSDDPDACEALAEKIAGLEAERARVKVVNTLIRAKGLQAALPNLTDAEKREFITLMRITPYHQVETKGWPAYHLTNLSGNINRLKKRLASLTPKPVTPNAPIADGRSLAFPDAGDTATARAGLRIIATMTTPAKSWKTPKPVWNVLGNCAMWRRLLERVGGSLYRGTWSFWDDPTDDIEAGCQDAEVTEQQQEEASHAAAV